MSGRDLFCQPRRFGRGATLTLVFASVLVAGAATGSLPRGPGDGPRSASGAAPATAPAGHSEDVARAAEEAAADGKSPLEAAERAVSRSGDRWAAVYSQGEYQEFEESLDGRYTGVGLEARRARGGRIEITKVQRGSPAAAAGIRAGDRLRTVDGRSVDGLPVTDVVALLRGDAEDASAGTPVRLGLERAARAWTETVRRALLSKDSVTVREVADRVTVVTVAAFTKGVGSAVRGAVRRAPAGGRIVLDLRGNSGGLVTEAVTTASVFLDGGLVATYDVDGDQRALHAEAGGDTRKPLVVLVDGGTMSAAELVTGALQDRGRAIVVGSRTFGKGSVQMPRRLPDGSVAELTVGHYRTPSGHGVDGRGITPDLEADDGALGRAETVLSGLGDTT
ncbi:S41 family peptidase [Streptomyces sp. NBC_00199]|uniref:S41 family peptidase n=1 Tax=Streptomyces sp. NBC_00199 TaxID=2975678 RepID=UPI00224F7B53|nr:S41 family peptidase [Streptomyces sp. NBC_00199]MCX5263829.1 S41 family peptidase [Streptomyces sp. NBC_00199]